MTSRILVDSCILINFLRQKEKSKTLFYKLSKEHLLQVSIITHTELYAGKSAWTKRGKKDLETIFGGLTLIPITESISESAGKLRASLSVDLIDALIASTAIQNKLPLATLNLKHFKGIPDLQILSID
ncbi:MAG TPA: type II toxin-antitoxin system VapC family toxin [candidate division WWE3 bacterium]|uniref:Type II toxin-antitoxin system VapC family toxin n=1 Tax=candidate division WWE3 bacterium TaxID=2053526 RepID=A0A7C1HDP7_UNCKA|nr:type II toxin-antitoxin system VapC family toxin [candidate division WWE3 bacterium]